MNTNEPAGMPDTEWSKLAAAAGGDDDAQAALDSLMRAYWRPLVRHAMIRFAYRQDSAEDVVQDFILRKILTAELLRRADPGKGRFRSLLLTALDNFIRDRWRAERGQPAPAPLDQSPSIPGNEAIAFDQEWAQAVIVQALHHMRLACQRKKQTNVWRVFFKRIVEPLVSPDDAPPFEQLAAECRLKSAAEARNLMQTGRRIFRRHLFEVIREYEHGEDEVASELIDLADALVSHGQKFRWDFDADSSMMGSKLDGESDLWMNIQDADLRELARLMQSPLRPVTDSHGELLRFELDSSAGVLAVEYAESGRLPAAVDLEQLARITVEDALFAPGTELPTLKFLRSAYRRRSRRSTRDVDRQVCKILYLAATAAVLLAYRVNPSKRATAEVVHDLRRASGLPWLTTPLRQLLVKAAESPPPA